MKRWYGDRHSKAYRQRVAKKMRRKNNTQTHFQYKRGRRVVESRIKRLQFFSKRMRAKGLMNKMRNWFGGGKK